MRERRQHGNGGAADGAEAGAPSANHLREAKLRQRMKQRRDAEPQADVVDAQDDGMSVVTVEEKEIQAVRDRLIARVNQAQVMGWLAADRFQSILRQRDAAPVLEKGFGETAKKEAVGWFKSKLKDGSKLIGIDAALAAVEIPLSPIAKGVNIAREGLEGVTQANQAGAKLEVIDRLVNETRHAVVRATDTARQAIGGAQPMDLFKADAAIDDQLPIISSGDVDELVTKLLALLTQELGQSGSLTANEWADRAKRDRENIGVETDKVKERQTE
jgi:hypothetical protein